MDSEEQLVNRIARAIPSVRGEAADIAAGYRLRLGIGDDSAVLAPSGRTDWVISCDAFLEGVHFLPHVHPADSAGYKSLVRATSDLAAMGATPRFFFLTLALPASRTGTWLDAFLKGMGRAARQLGMQLAGGDTTKFASVAVSITVLGEAEPGSAVTRSGAKPGDLIYVSGTLGRSHLGLDLIRHGFGKRKRSATLLQPHLYPQIRVELGSWLAKKGITSAMLDISDGLSTDLARLCQSSGVGALVESAAIPAVEIPSGIAKLLPKIHLDPLRMALHGGEDYELLFTVPRSKLQALRRAPGFSGLRAIGEVTQKKGLFIVSPNGVKQRLEASGWDPFRKS